ncbi:MAG: tetratricopeptide repeat protein [Pseudomonadota bacterium]
MQLSTVKRERLIPPVYLLSIALLLTVAFIVLLPSRDAFTLSRSNLAASSDKVEINDLDVAYIRAASASGNLPASDMKHLISRLIRGQRWADATSLMAERPDITLDESDNFLLRLESARQGYLADRSAADNSSYAAELITLLTNFLDNDALHDIKTLSRASQVSAELEQPELSASYRLVLADKDPDNAVNHLYACAQILAQYQLNGQAESCYRTAIANNTDPTENFELTTRLIYLLSNMGDSFTANKELENLVRIAPQKTPVYTRLSAIALSLERPDIAYPLYARLSELDNTRAIMWLEKAAKWSEASNLPGLSAEYLATIIELSDERFRNDLIKRRQALLIAAGRNEEALQTVHERLISQPSNAELLHEAIALASNMGLYSQAMQWNEQLLDVRPYDTDAIHRQVDLALATSQIGNALQWARTLVQIEPGDRDSRIKLAQLEEWNGNIDNAQQQRTWLASAYPSDANDFELVRISELNWDAATAALTLQRIGSRKPLSRENILKLVRLHEDDGRPDRAASVLLALQKGSNADPMLYRELAALHKRHKKWDKSLAAWESFAERFGRSSEESINRMELHWRLNEPERAHTLAKEVTEEYLASASAYQLELMSNLGWRYRDPQLVLASAPYLERTDLHDGKRMVLARRIVQSHLDQQNPEAAIEYAEWVWRSGGDKEFLFSALNIALEEDLYPHSERYLDATGELISLRDDPDYWLVIGDYHNKRSDTDAALDTFENTLRLQPDNIDAMNGMLWSLMGQNPVDEKRLADTLDKYQETAIDKPALWSPFALAHLRLKDPNGSLRWFSKIMLQDEHDYNVLLSFADALEQSGNAPHAFKVRQYTLNKLRPLVLAQTDGQTDELARDYISLLQRYGSTGENETWTERLLADAEHATGEEAAWRQEMAAAWYLSTQRNDFARLILTKMHEKRLQTPAWQRLALAVVDDDFVAIEEILASGEPLSSGDQILALHKVGKEKEAFQLASDTRKNSLSESEIRNATDHMIAMRVHRPGYTAGSLNRKAIANLDITESALSLRHTLAAVDLGFSVDYNRRYLTRGNTDIINRNEDDVAVTMHFGNSLRGGSVTTGVNAREEDDLQYSGGQLYFRDRAGKNEISTEVYINEIATSSEDQRLAAKRDRAELSYAHTLGKNQYVRLSGSLDEVITRAGNLTVSTGVGASIELGTMRSIGSNSWSMGVVASQKNRSAKGELATAANGTALFTDYGGSFSSDSQELALNAALFRGGITSEYPQAASPRYHLRARLGHNWPTDATAFTLSAGAGIRVVGNDELSFSVEHDSNIDPSVDTNATSTVGIQYTNHF